MIQYFTDRAVTADQLADVFDRSGIVRPTTDAIRMTKMATHGNLLISAWEGDLLVGVARGFTDFAWVCYLSDLAVDTAFQKSGVGRTLLKMVEEIITPQASLILNAAPSAMEYYPKMGFTLIKNGWMVKRKL